MPIWADLGGKVRPAAAVLTVLATVVAKVGTISAQASSMADTIGIVEAAITAVGAEAQGMAVVIVPMKDSALTSRIAVRLGLPHKSRDEFVTCDHLASGVCRFEHPALLLSVDRVTIVGDSARVTVHSSHPESSSHIVTEDHYVFVLRRRDGRWRLVMVLGAPRPS